LLRLLLEERFPRIWVPGPRERDLRQLVVHRQRLVELQTRVKNQLQAVAINEGLRRGRKLWSQAGREQLCGLELTGWTARRRQDLLAVLEGLEPLTEELRAEIERQAHRHPQACRLMTHPGVGPVTALAFVLTLGPVERFPRGKQVASYFGLAPREHSSGGRQRLGHISKQGSPFLRMLLVEAAQSAVRHEPQLARDYLRWRAKKNSAIAKVAAARKLAVRLYWMLRSGCTYAQLASSHAGQPESSCGRRTRPIA
jgi:transposase